MIRISSTYTCRY